MLNKLVNILSVASIVFMLATLTVVLFGGGALKNVLGFAKNSLATVIDAAESVFSQDHQQNTQNSTSSNQTFYKYSFDPGAQEIEIEESTTTEEIDTTDWRIFYTKLSSYDYSALSFKYPKDFSAIAQEDSILVSYEVDGELYTTTFNTEKVFIPKQGYDEIVSTTTKIGQQEYEKTSYIKNSTTTLNSYIPVEGEVYFSSVVSMLPEKESFEYEKIIEKILETLNLEKAVPPLVIKHIKVWPQTIQLDSPHSFGSNFAYTFSTRKQGEFGSFVIYPFIVDERDYKLYEFEPITSLKQTKFTHKPFSLCDGNQKEGDFCIPASKLNKKHFIKMLGFACLASYPAQDCPEELKMYIPEKYSNPFVFVAPVEFSQPKIRIIKEPILTKVKASVYGYQFGFDYALVFSDGSFTFLQRKGNNLYETEVIKTLENIDEIALVRVAKDIANNKFYGEKKYENILRYSDVLLVKKIEHDRSR